MDPDPKPPGGPEDDTGAPPNPFTQPPGGGVRAVSPFETDPSAGELLVALGRLARDTRRALRIALLHGGGRLPSAVQLYLEGTLNHLGQVREGFAISLRTADCSGRLEMEDLVTEILVDWSWMARLGFQWIPAGVADPGRMGPGQPDRPQLERPLAQLLAYAHARIALGALPRVPEDQVTFPAHRRSYADIPVPRSAGDVLVRIDELERVISVTLEATCGGRAGEEPVHRLGRDRLRRAYGFFETSAWLVERVCG